MLRGHIHPTAAETVDEETEELLGEIECLTSQVMREIVCGVYRFVKYDEEDKANPNY